MESMIYQTKTGELQVKLDKNNDTIWATQAQIAMLFDKDRSVITKHINNLLKNKEIDKSNVQKMHIASSDKPIAIYDLDVVLSIGYRVNSPNAIKFRKWANEILKQHITKGYSINKSIIANNYGEFMDAIKNIESLVKENGLVGSDDVLELVKTFANTWLSLDAYDKNTFPEHFATKKDVDLTFKNFSHALDKFKSTILEKEPANALFGKERHDGGVEGIFHNVMQSFGNEDLYPTIEEKAVNLIYFMVKDHPYFDGNKRCAAYSFIWFLHANGILNTNKITPEALTTLTLLIAESSCNDRDKIIKLTLQLLK